MKMIQDDIIEKYELTICVYDLQHICQSLINIKFN